MLRRQIIYRHADVPQHRVPIPRRKNPLEHPSRGLVITADVMHKMKVIPFNLFFSSNFKPAFNQGVFFFLLQSEDGDLYKVTIEHEEEEVKSLRIKYFATVPVASSLCILISGFLFVASDFGNQSALFLLSCSMDCEFGDRTKFLHSLHLLVPMYSQVSLPGFRSLFLYVADTSGVIFW